MTEAKQYAGLGRAEPGRWIFQPGHLTCNLARPGVAPLLGFAKQRFLLKLATGNSTTFERWIKFNQMIKFNSRAPSVHMLKHLTHGRIHIHLCCCASCHNISPQIQSRHAGRHRRRATGRPVIYDNKSEALFLRSKFSPAFQVIDFLLASV